MNRRVLRAAGVFSFFALVIVIAFPLNSEEYQDVPLRVASVPVIGDMQRAVATKADLYDNTPAFVSYPDVRGVLDALHAEEVDVVSSGPLWFVRHVLRTHGDGTGDLPVILATNFNSFSVHALLVRQSDGIKTLADLEGARVARTLGVATEYLVAQMAATTDLNPETLVFVDMDISEARFALSDGRVDAVLTWEPITSAWLQDETLGFQRAEGAGDAEVSWFLMTRRSVLEARREALVAYLTALEKAETRYYADPVQALGMIEDEFDLLPDSASAVYDNFDFNLSLSPTILIALQAAEAWLCQREALPGCGKVQWVQFVEPDLVRQVLPMGTVRFRSATP
ncbi:ABC transporter substrate-binding protein [Rhodovulum adriaticum]|nr:ABC transporter substrate-binding protein [Rhodovulum adriaticum]